MGRRSMIALMFAATAPLVVPAEAMVLCSGRSGSGVLRMRAACRAREKPVDPVSLGLSTSAGPARSVVVKDVNGNFVGLLDGAGPNTYAWRRIGDVTVRMGMSSSGQLGCSAYLKFQSTDCTGTALMFPSDLPIANLRPACSLAGNLYYPSSTISTRTAQSEERGDDSPAECAQAGGTLTARNTCCRPFTSRLATGEWADAVALDLAGLGLTPPFHVEGP